MTPARSRALFSASWVSRRTFRIIHPFLPHDDRRASECTSRSAGAFPGAPLGTDKSHKRRYSGIPGCNGSASTRARGPCTCRRALRDAHNVSLLFPFSGSRAIFHQRSRTLRDRFPERGIRSPARRGAIALPSFPPNVLSRTLDISQLTVAARLWPPATTRARTNTKTYFSILL